MKSTKLKVITIGFSISFVMVFLVGCLTPQQFYSNDIFTAVTDPEEGNVQVTILTKESDIVEGPQTMLKTEAYANGNTMVNTEVLMWNTATYLAVSPDGKNFTFLGNNNNSSNLFIRSTEGGAAAIQRTFRNDVEDFTYSKDGKYLSFSDRVGVGSYSNLNIYMIDVNKGSAVRQIASGNEDEQNPEFSDDGNLLFYSKNNNGNYTLWSQDLKSGLMTQYSEGFNPCIVPNTGSKQLFVTRRAKNSTRTEIWRVGIDGDGESQYITDSRRSFSSPKVSPNGKYLLCTGSTPKSNSRPSNLDLYLYKIDGTGETQLTFHPGTDASAVWAPDSKSILFISSRGSITNKYNVWRMNIEKFLDDSSSPKK